MEKCSICNEETERGSRIKDEFTCDDCINCMVETIESEVHLRTKHTPEELAKLMVEKGLPLFQLLLLLPVLSTSPQP